MKHHGALCYNTDYESTFLVATELEEACYRFIQEEYLKASGNSEFDSLALGLYSLSLLTKNTITPLQKDNILSCESERTNQGFKLMYDNETFEIPFDKQNELLSTQQELLQEASLHNETYKKNPSIHNIIHANTTGIQSVAFSGVKQFPLLDDFAQIAGTSVLNLPVQPEPVSIALRKSSVVFLHNNGALCCGATKGDAEASALVAEKNCNALISAALFGKVKYINALESKLMRFVYLKKYSKQANK